MTAAALNAFERAGVIAVLRAPSAELAVRSVAALISGGITAVEITYTTPGAGSVIRQVQDRYGSDVLVGAGTVRSAAQAQDAVAAGAQFLVSPGTRPDLAEALVATKVPTMLGVLSPSELMAAVDAGATAIKLFPASLGGPSLLRALRGPFPDVAIIPTGGVRPDNIADWFDAGALAVGAGSELCAPDAMSQGRWDEIEQRAATFSAALRTVRHRS